MALVKITDLDPLVSGSTEFTADVLPIVDITADTTYKITLNELKGALGLNNIGFNNNGGFVSGSLNLSGSLTLTGSISTADYIDFNTNTSPSHLEGRIHWNPNTKTVQIDTDRTNFSIDTGHQSVVRVYNGTGVDIQSGSVVYINGAQGNVPTIATASWTIDPTSAGTIGFAATTIPGTGGNRHGYVVTSGLLTNVNTAGFAVGDRLYLSSSGQFTNVAPDAPLHEVRLGVVIVSNASTGVIFVNVVNGFELTELHDVVTSTLRNLDVLTYESSTDLWVNKQPTQYYRLYFNNISNYDVNGGAGTQNLGAGTTGMQVTQDLDTLHWVTNGSNRRVRVKVLVHEQYGGVTNQIGLRTVYSSAGGATFFDTSAIANRITQFGSNFALQTADLTIDIPITYLGSPTDYFKFELIVTRVPAGSTGVIGSELIFYS